jgi:hypothetical protein
MYFLARMNSAKPTIMTATADAPPTQPWYLSTARIWKTSTGSAWMVFGLVGKYPKQPATSGPKALDKEGLAGL